MLTAVSLAVAAIPDALSGRCNHLGLGLNNNTRTDKEENTIGDPTEIALFTIAREKGFDKKELERAFPRKGEISFDAERKCMTKIHELAGSDEGQGTE